MKNAAVFEPTKQPVEAQRESDEIDLTELLRTIWRGKFWIGLCATIALFIGIWYAFFVATPVYTASSLVALETQVKQTIDIESVVGGLGGDQSSINTEVEVIQSRELVEKVVRELDLTSDPEFNKWLRPESTFSVGNIISTIRELFGETKVEETPPTEREVLDAVIDAVLQSITASNIRQSYVFKITAVTESPAKSVLIANTLAEFYIRDQIAVKFEKTKQATEWLTDRVSQLQIELENAEAELKEFSRSTELVSAEALSGLNRQLKDLRDRLADTSATAESRDQQLEKMQVARASGSLAEMAEAASDRTLEALVARIESGTASQADFNARFDQILDRVALERARAFAQADTLQQSITRTEREIKAQSSELVTLQQLQREAEASRLIYEHFLGRLKETSVQQGIQQPDSRILSRAVVPQSPSAPRKSIILVLSLMLGGMAGIAFVLGREFSQTTFRTPEDLESRTGYTVLGQIPAIPARRRSNVLKYLTDKPNSAAAEAIRNLRTSILMSDLDNPAQVIMSTSSVPGEGKTTQSLALTQNLSGMGKKVLLIEGDIRRRIFAEYFHIEGNKGLVSVLSGEEAFEDIVVHEPTLNADLLVGDKSSINAADVFSSEKFRTFLNDLREKYDHIIIDTPPVLAVPDARVIGRYVDRILYTVKWDSTSHRMVREGLKSFESVNLQVAGLVLGQISPQGMKKYGYGNSYGAYSAYHDN